MGLNMKWLFRGSHKLSEKPLRIENQSLPNSSLSDI
jgi:hypothetical protein